MFGLPVFIGSGSRGVGGESPWSAGQGFNLEIWIQGVVSLEGRMSLAAVGVLRITGYGPSHLGDKGSGVVGGV